MPVLVSGVRGNAGRRRLLAALAGLLLGQIGVVAFLALPLWLAPADTSGWEACVDWRTYLSAVAILRGGQGTLLYDLPSLGAVQAAMGVDRVIAYPYHPAFLLLVYPFTLLPLGISFLA